MFSNKRGSVLDWFVIIVIVLITAIMLFAAKIVADKVDVSGIFDDDPTASAVMKSTQSTLLSFDHLMLFVIIGLSLAVLISSALVYNHPGFFIAGIFLLFIAIIIAAMVSNTFWVFSNSSAIATTAAMYPKITFLMEKLPFYILFLGMATAAVMYIGHRRQ
ncbi:MAG: hypothetical protein JRL30_26005 [Deltaproteobacteria bacterium]|nr:hypothetical protein [Deltaproteobacteria bacterium]